MLKHAIQRCQLKAFHSDAHWCIALYKYLRKCSFENRDTCVFISSNDKAKVQFCEADSTVVRGGGVSIVPVGSVIAVP